MTDPPATENRPEEKEKEQPSSAATEPEPPATAAEGKDSPFWSTFSRADKRMLIVTFAGTVAANVVTAAVVAIGIILYRLWVRPSSSPGWLKDLVIAAAFATMLVGLAGLFRRALPDRWLSGLLVAFGIVILLWAVFFGLVFLGEAAGLK